MQGLVAWLRKNMKALISSGIIALAISIGCYYFNSSAEPFGDATTPFSILEILIQRHFEKKEQSYDAAFINTSYDRELISHYDKLSGKHTESREAISSRRKLLEFLEFCDSLNQSGNPYRYIFIDIEFDPNDISDDPSVDTALFKKISSMPNILLAKSWDSKNDMDSDFPEPLKTAPFGHVDYKITILHSGFSRYQYIQHNAPSAPLVMYRDLCKRDIKKHFLWYSDKGKLCQNALRLTFPSDFSSKWNLKYGLTPNYYDIQSEVLSKKDEMKPFLPGKIIIIGDFVEDIHGTYSGSQPGPYINYIAYKSLEQGKHLVKWWFVLLITLVYWLLAFCIIKDISTLDKLPVFRNISNRFLLFILSLVGYSVILSGISILLFIIFHNIFSILIPSTVFSVLSLYKSYKQV